MVSMILGIIGVVITLIAFALNLLDKITVRSKIYLIMNIVGALMAAWYAFEGEVYPFIVLELVWALAASIRLFGILRCKKHV